MRRYIDVDLAVDEIIKDMCGVSDIDEGLGTAISELRLMPTADVVEVVHGEWVMLNPSLAKCSACGGYESTNGKDLTMKGIIFKEMKRYCPHCGARMDLQ